MDIALKVRQKCKAYRAHSGFNPYSDGYCSESYAYYNISFVSLQVSILILMDIALKEGTVSSCRLPYSCFNPYSDGYCSESSIPSRIV